MNGTSASTRFRFFSWAKCQIGWTGNWDSWVHNLSSLHQSTWKKAGIYEAIMGTTYPITRHGDLVFELASRWRSNTNTFVFPWGEATITLEDMLVLGGFSALGVSAFRSAENDADSLEIEKRLDAAKKDLQCRDSKRKVSQSKWMDEFKGSGSELEHVAFLTMWLSRFVFAKTSGDITRNLFRIAARLSKGTKIALGPAVLAMMYRDLTVLQKSLSDAETARNVYICSPLYLVQIWAWERFPVLKPVPNRRYLGENFPRTARWSNLKISTEIDLRSAIDSAKESFLWCPYEREGRDTGRCVKTAELNQLVGFEGCVETYHPQRVARQFGFDLNTSVDSCGPLGFMDVVGSNSGHLDSENDCGQMMKESVGTHVPETMSGKLFPCSVHELGKDKGKVGENRHDEVEERSSCYVLNEVTMRFDGENFLYEASDDFDLEARIQRLEKVVYARRKAPKSGR